MRVVSLWSGHWLTLLVVLPASLFIGVMIASAGVAVYPPIATVATPLVCSGEVEVESQNYSYRPGQSGVTRTIYCLSENAGGKAAREDITLKTIGAAFLVYSVIAFLILRLLVVPLLRRRFAGVLRRAGIRGAPDAGVTGGGGAGTGVDLQSILAQVAEAVERGEAKVTVRDHRFVAPGGDGPADDDPAERLAQLKRLYDRGLISAADYETKKAEILAGL